MSTCLWATQGLRGRSQSPATPFFIGAFASGQSRDSWKWYHRVPVDAFLRILLLYMEMLFWEDPLVPTH